MTHDSACSCQESLCGDCSLHGGDDQCFCVCEPALRGDSTTHDPLCPRFMYDMPCLCNLIERVRINERGRTVKSPSVVCPECFEHVELRIDLVQHVDEEGDLSIQVSVDPQPVWDHAAKHVWDGGAAP